MTDCGSATGYPGQDGSVGGDKRFTELATGAILDEDSKLVWSTTSEPASTLTDAGIFCADDATADKQGRWRLPTRYELQTLVDYGADTGALIDTETFPNTLTTEYWTSTPFAGDPSNVVWVVSFQTGEVLRSATLAPDTAVFCVMTQAEFDL